MDIYKIFLKLRMIRNFLYHVYPQRRFTPDHSPGFFGHPLWSPEWQFTRMSLRGVPLQCLSETQANESNINHGGMTRQSLPVIIIMPFGLFGKDCFAFPSGMDSQWQYFTLSIKVRLSVLLIHFEQLEPVEFHQQGTPVCPVLVQVGITHVNGVRGSQS